jgi:hypothetical protein
VMKKTFDDSCLKNTFDWTPFFSDQVIWADVVRTTE